MGDFYVLRLGEDLRLGGLEVVRFWAPEALGYVLAVERAGVYTAETIAGDAWRYNNGESAAAVPCALVEAVAVKRLTQHGELHIFPQRELARVVRAAARVAAYRAACPRGGADGEAR